MIAHFPRLTPNNPISPEAGYILQCKHRWNLRFATLHKKFVVSQRRRFASCYSRLWVTESQPTTPRHGYSVVAWCFYFELFYARLRKRNADASHRLSSADKTILWPTSVAESITLIYCYWTTMDLPRHTKTHLLFPGNNFKTLILQRTLSHLLGRRKSGQILYAQVSPIFHCRPPQFGIQALNSIINISFVGIQSCYVGTVLDPGLLNFVKWETLK
jgi:hypothetical protein